jgi:hypothetical protein
MHDGAQVMHDGGWAIYWWGGSDALWYGGMMHCGTVDDA